MSDDVEYHGPIDFVLIEFPGDRPLRSTAQALLNLVDRGVVELYDIVAVRKAEDDTFSALELSDIDEGDAALVALAGARSGMLSDDDVRMSVDAMEPGTVALLLVYENTWAVPFVAAAMGAGGQMIASERIPAQDVVAVLDALETGD